MSGANASPRHERPLRSVCEHCTSVTVVPPTVEPARSRRHLAPHAVVSFARCAAQKCRVSQRSYISHLTSASRAAMGCSERSVMPPCAADQCGNSRCRTAAAPSGARTCCGSLNVRSHLRQASPDHVMGRPTAITRTFIGRSCNARDRGWDMSPRSRALANCACRQTQRDRT